MKDILIASLMAVAVMIFAAGCGGNGDNPASSTIGFKSIDDDAQSLSLTVEGGPGHRWGDHADPWNFLWDNGLDNNHEFKMTGNGSIHGFMYIEFTEGDTAIGGTDYVGWIVHGIPAEAYWNDDEDMWVVSVDDVPVQQGFVHWHPLGDEEEAREMESAPGFFLKHTARLSFYFAPQERWVEPGIDFDFPNNYITE